MKEKVQILPVNPETFETQEYNSSDQELLTVSELNTAFSGSTDYIEIAIYDENQNKIYTTPEGETLTTFNVKEGDVLLSPQQDLERLGFDIDTYFINYNFYRKRLSSDSTQKYFISQISSDRTEIALDSNDIELDQILTSSAEFIQFREDATYFVDFYLNFGSNQSVIANNIKIDNEQVLIKLYEPLPVEFDVKSTLWVVEEISTPQAYQVTFPFTPEIPDDFTFISGPNFNLKVQGETGVTSQDFSYNTLIDSNVTSSVNQIQSLLAEKQININVNYEDFNQFIHFSSAKTRLENFYYKVGLIESASNQLSEFLDQITSDTSNTLAFSSSKAELTSQIDTIIKNFDGYEYFLYFNSGSQFSYPKSNTEPPFTLYSTGSTEVLNWIGSADPDSPYYGGVALSASDYDQDNKDWLYWAIPEYLRTDPDNLKYELFVDMVGQHYDNIWLYTKDITNKFDADNRLEYGISKDLVADAIKDFGVKLYSNNFNINDLYTAFLGLTPSGSLFPFPEITGSLPTPTGYEYVDTRISASNEVIPLNDVNKRLYKRIYHNIPYLLKTKGTIAGLRALITSYGIPDTILRVNEFGGKDRNESQDWDLKQNIFNYAFNTGEDSDNFITSSFDSNTNFGNTSPSTVQFRFKSSGIPPAVNNVASSNIRYSQSLFLAGQGDSAIVLEYTGSGFVTGSYSGSVASPYDTYGTLKFIPDTTDVGVSASIYLPFFNEDWWSVQVNIDENTPSATLYAANEIGGKLGFSGSDQVTSFDISYWQDAAKGFLNTSSDFTPGGAGGTYQPFSGSFQELRYWNVELSESKFFDYTVNPYSNEGNTINSTPNELFFRAALGTQLNTGSRTSIHPKVTGSAVQITQSFANDSEFYIETTFYPWVTNVENIYQDQVLAGIKNRVTDKMEVEANIIAESPYGIVSGSSTPLATISGENALSPFRSIQTTSYLSQSYTPDVNYLEVALSPQNQINDDINAQIGYFNIGEYIGDPRQISSSARNYPDLDTLRDAYFEKYIKSYDVVDFVRLMKFFDNSLFKMIKDFTPARTSLSSGVVVKQHILERNRQRQAQASSSMHNYSGSIKPQSRNYSTGSGDTGAYEFVSGSSIYKFSGGTGGSFEKFNGLHTSPSASAYGLTNRFGITQSFSESIEYSIADRINNSGSFVGYRDVIISDQKEFYDGEFSGSNLEVTDMIANPNCAPYLKVTDQPIFFNPLFFSLTFGNFTQGTITEEEAVLNTNNPVSGDAWVISEQVRTSPPLSKVRFIRLSNSDNNGVVVGDYLDDSNSIKIVLPDAIVSDNGGVAEYFIEGVTEFADSTLLRISQDMGDNREIVIDDITYYPITSSENGGSENWSLQAKGNYNTSDNLTQSADNVQQGRFGNSAASSQTQYFWYYNGDINDEQSFFNTGSEDVTFNDILTNPTFYSHGAYSPTRTSNIPWLFSASFAYSASDLGSGNSITQSGQIYHSASKYSGAQLFNQDFQFKTNAPITRSGTFIPSPLPSQIQLNSSIFKDITDYNTNIPGNSGSEAGEKGGHPKIKLPGTASIDFHFPSLTITGSARELTPDSPIFTALSGSALSSNDDFNMSFFGYGVTSFSGSAGDERDGAIQIDQSSIESYISTYLGASNPYFSYGEMYIDAVISGSAPFTASLFYDVYSDNEGGGVNYTQEFTGGEEYFSDSNNEIIIASHYIDLIFGSGNNPGMLIRWQIKGNSNEAGETMEYFFKEFSSTMTVDYEDDSGGGSTSIPSGGGNVMSTTAFQGSISNKQDFEFEVEDSGDQYPDFKIQAILKRTGSGIPPEGYIITSSQPYLGKEVFGGTTFEFPDSPIENIFQPDPLFQNTTINNEDDMYYIEYSMSQYDDKSVPVNKTYDIGFSETGDTGSKIIIEQRALSPGGGTYDLSGSVIINQGSTENPTTVGNQIFSEDFIIDDETSTGRINLTGSFTHTFTSKDVFRMGMNVSKSFGSAVTITEYTMSIFPSSSVYAPLNSPPEYDLFKEPTSSGFVIPTYFGEDILPFNRALDCQPTLNNYNDIRLNSYIMDVDYTNVTGSITPVNQEQLVNKTAVKASIPDSNYTSLRSINPRYDGVKSICKEINVWNIGDTGTFGKNPNINLKDAFFGYFNDLDDPYPNINGLTRVNLNYLIDEQGNALPPSLEGLGADTLRAVFPISTQIKIAAQQGNRRYQVLGEPNNIAETLKYYSPIMYSQNSGDNYTNIIPLSGSGYISRYDNDDESSVVFAQFVAQGTASVDTSSPQLSVDYYLDPSEEITKGSGVDPSYDPWNSAGYTNYPVSEFGGSIGDDLSNAQAVSLKHSIFTTLVSETNRVGKEMKFELHMYTGSQDPTTEVAFNLKDITCKVYTEDGKVTSIGSVLEYGWFDFENIVTWREKRVKRSVFNAFRRGIRFWKTTLVPVPTGGIKFSVDGYEMWDTLYDRGLIRVNKPKDYGGVIAMEWTIEANSGAYTIKVGDEINWRVLGQFKDARRGYRQGYFFPDEYTGVKTPTKIQGQGIYDHLQSEANTAQAPFWVYTGSAGLAPASQTIISQSVLVMSSSNMNEAYGTGFAQGDLEYYPGPSPYFPGGVEPQTTAFDKIEYTLDLVEGDEIRFGNNENFTYRINRVVPPEENIEGGKGRLKIFLDGNVDTSVNKDFFLIRRPVPNPNSMYLDVPFPYNALASASISTGIVEYTGSRFALSGSINSGSGGDSDLSGSYSASFSELEIQSTPGILYPDFPTDFLIQSASSIVNDLISKGIIQS